MGDESDDEAPWRRLTSKEDIKTLCQKAGVEPSEIMIKEIRYPLDLTQWWELNMSTGYRGMIDKLSEDAFATVKSNYFNLMQEHCNENGEVTLLADSFYTRIESEGSSKKGRK